MNLQSTLLGSIRCKTFGIDVRETTVLHRKFRVADQATLQRIEEIGQSFVHGYHAALRFGLSGDHLRHSLEEVPKPISGFAYEGAGMGLVVQDLLISTRFPKFQRFVHEFGSKHKYMVYVGAGWAFARFFWGLRGFLKRMDPLLSWLAIDGLGFHSGYFDWRKCFDSDRAPYRLSGYSRRVFDQGLGRSIWFVRGADKDLTVDAINRFDDCRRPDLWAGLGLAAAYAGGAEDETLRGIRKSSGRHFPHLAQGVAFAAKARLLANNVTTDTEAACETICNLSVGEAAALTDRSLVALPFTDSLPAYEHWRGRIQNHFRQSAKQ